MGTPPPMPIVPVTEPRSKSRYGLNRSVSRSQHRRHRPWTWSGSGWRQPRHSPSPGERLCRPISRFTLLADALPTDAPCSWLCPFAAPRSSTGHRAQ